MQSDTERAYSSAVQDFLVVYRYLRRYSQQIHESGHSGRQLSSLRYLLENDDVTMGKLAAYLYITESSTTELVSKLEADGLVARERSRKDNRVVLVSITAAGRRVARETSLGGIPLLRERLRTLSPHEIRKVDDAFRLLKDLLEIREEA